MFQHSGSRTYGENLYLSSIWQGEAAAVKAWYSVCPVPAPGLKCWGWFCLLRPACESCRAAPACQHTGCSGSCPARVRATQVHPGAALTAPCGEQEIKYYNFANPGFSPSTGHATQVLGML